MELNVLTVSGLNAYIKSIFESDENLQYVFLSGEISNFTAHSRSGHMYFSLKDEKCTVRCVMFAGFARGLRFRPQEGMDVIIRGKVSVYEVSGQYQVYVEDMHPFGQGVSSIAFEKLKQKLFKEGLFDGEHKKVLPVYPHRIGVITSDSGAALYDIKNVLGRRYPLCELVLYPVSVQGRGAAMQMVEAVNFFNSTQDVDLIILARGGGSAEDLWEFNDENLARAIFECSIPLISAVGHEVDYTISDFVADMRAPTPSAAAEIAVPDIKDLKFGLDAVTSQLQKAIADKIQLSQEMIRYFEKMLVRFSPKTQITNRELVIRNLSSRLKAAYAEKIEKDNAEYTKLAAVLDSLSPMKTLARGYSVMNKDDKVISSIDNVNVGDDVKVTLCDGDVYCAVYRKEVRDSGR